MHLGPMTEARFREAFATGAFITAKAAASLLGVDVDTLSEMTARGEVSAVPRGKRLSYTEAGLRSCIEGETQNSEVKPQGKVAAPRRLKPTPFSERPGRNPPRASA